MTRPLDARASPRVRKSALSQQIAEGRVIIEAVSPLIDCGDTPIKRIVGDTLNVEATVFTDGHEKIAVDLLYRPEREAEWHRARMDFVENDRWTGSISLEENARYLYTIEAWRDPFASWHAGLEKKRDAGQDLSLELEHGLDLIRATKPRTRSAMSARDAIIAAAEGPGGDPASFLLEPRVLAFMSNHGRRDNVSRYSRELVVIVDRKAAAFSSWYELFPRSQTPTPRQHGTFNGVISRLPYVRDLGFTLLRQLGMGEFGRVYEALNDNSTNYPGRVALKVDRIVGKKKKAILEAEQAMAVGRALARSPHLMRLYDTGKLKGQRFTYHVLQLINGDTLDNLVGVTGTEHASVSRPPRLMK